MDVGSLICRQSSILIYSRCVTILPTYIRNTRAVGMQHPNWVALMSLLTIDTTVGFNVPFKNALNVATTGKT